MARHSLHCLRRLDSLVRFYTTYVFVRRFELCCTFTIGHPFPGGTLTSLLAESLHDARLTAQASELRERQQRERGRHSRQVGDAVMTIDVEGRVNFMNRVAESLSGWSNIEALGKLLDHVFTLVNEQTRQRVANPTMQALDHGVIAGLANHNVLIAKMAAFAPSTTVQHLSKQIAKVALSSLRECSIAAFQP